MLNYKVFYADLAKFTEVYNYNIEKCIHIWLSCVAIEDYSVAYVDHIAAFEASYC